MDSYGLRISYSDFEYLYFERNNGSSMSISEIDTFSGDELRTSFNTDAKSIELEHVSLIFQDKDFNKDQEQVLSIEDHNLKSINDKLSKYLSQKKESGLDEPKTPTLSKEVSNFLDKLDFEEISYEPNRTFKVSKLENQKGHKRYLFEIYSYDKNSKKENIVEGHVINRTENGHVIQTSYDYNKRFEQEQSRRVTPVVNKKIEEVFDLSKEKEISR